MDTPVLPSGFFNTTPPPASTPPSSAPSSIPPPTTLTPEQVQSMGGQSVAPQTLTPAQVKSMGGTPAAAGAEQPTGSLSQYQEQSANPASTSVTPTPSAWDKFWSGTPLSPITADETSGGNGGAEGGLKLIGSMFANAISDIPAVASGAVQLLEPWKYPAIAKGLVNSAKNITEETAGAISDGLKTGNWSRLGQDVQKAEITIGNHPLQSVLGFEGALSASKFAAGAARDSVIAASDPNVPFEHTPTGQAIKGTIDSINNTKNNIVKLFEHQTTLTEHAQQLNELAKQSIEQNKAYTDAKNTVESFQENIAEQQAKLSDLKTQVESASSEDKANLQEQLNQNQAQMDQAIQDHISAQKDLQTAQDKITQLYTDKVNEVNQETANQMAETRLKSGFDSQETNLNDSVANFARNAYERESGLYKENLGNAQINSDTIVKGLEDYKDALRNVSKRDSVPYAQGAIDELKLRDIVNSSPDEKVLYKRLNESGIDPKKWENLNPDQLHQEYPPLTSENFKQTRNALYEGISRKANETSEYQYNNTVKPAFDKAFADAVREQYGSERVDTIRKIDEAWANLKSNPLFDKDAKLSFDKIVKNWSDFSKSVSKVPGGEEMISRIQNFAAERVLANSENPLKPGTFDYNKILKGLDKYENVLGDQLTTRLLRVAQDNKILEEEQALRTQQLKDQKAQLKQSIKEKVNELKKTKETVIKEATKKAAETKETVASIKAAAKKVESDARDVGADKPDFIKNVQAIDSPEKLQEFLNKSGKTAPELGAVVMRNVFSPVADAVESKDFDPKMIGDALDKIDKLGKGDTTVKSALLGPETEADLKNLRDKYSVWEKATEGHKGEKTFASRTKDIATGALILAILPFGKFFGYRKLLSGISPSSDSLAALGERLSGAEKIISNLPGKKIAEAGVIAKAAEKENK